MATIIGSLRDNPTNGEQLVYKLLDRLPQEYLVWPELAVDDRHPDFVILHPRLGVCVLEVKDWYEATEATPDRVRVLAVNNKEHSETNPQKAVREKAFTIVDRLQQEPRLRHESGAFAGRLRVPYAYAVVFANIHRMYAGILAEVIDSHVAIYRDDLKPEGIEAALHRLEWKFEAQLSEADVDLIRGALYPELRVARPGAGGRITFSGVADLTQEQVAKEGLHERRPREERDVTEAGKRAAASMAVRMVRGVAGSGKTLVLVLRAKYLARVYPQGRILVLAFNRALAEQLKGHFEHYAENITVSTFHALCQQVLISPDHWQSGPLTAEDRRARLRAAIAAVPGAGRYQGNLAFVEEEITWMKEVGIKDRAAYLEVPRQGRGQRLSREEREVIFQVYQAYQEKLLALRRFDWDDAAGMALAALDDGAAAHLRYDAVLVDEAQDFAPVWFDVLRRVMRTDTGAMFLAADGAQRIYRHYSWKSLGLDVVGRTRVLRRSYRNSYEIAQVAAELLRDQPSIQAALKQEDDEPDPVVLEERWMRHGPRPTVHPFNGEAPERRWLANQIRRLITEEGYRPEEIAVFEHDAKSIEATREALRAERLPVRALTDSGNYSAIGTGTMHAAKGLEFRAVFVLRLDQLFRKPSFRLPDDEQRIREAADFRLLYVAMTRAREQLFFEYRYPLPPQLERFITYVKQNAAA